MYLFRASDGSRLATADPICGGHGSLPIAITGQAVRFGKYQNDNRARRLHLSPRSWQEKYPWAKFLQRGIRKFAALRAFGKLIH